jgi:hypothetical protein
MRWLRLILSMIALRNCQPKVIDLFKWKELPTNGQHANLILALPEIILFILQSFISDIARSNLADASNSCPVIYYF